jgi:hypothetical protein
VSGCCHQAADCDDGVYCNGEEVCSDHACAAGAVPDCTDAYACTTDGCDAGRDQCIHEPDNGQCPQDQICDPSEGCMDPSQCVDDVYEENDAWGAAAPVQSEETVFGKICPGDEDWFSFEASMGSDIGLVISFSREQGDVDLTLYNQALDEVGDKDTASDGVVFIGYGPVEVPQKFYARVAGVEAVIHDYFFVAVIDVE